jgi:hypothetical protein
MTADELLLVRAAVAEGPVALDAWDRCGGIDRVDGEAFALLPQVYRNLESASYAGADLGRLKGIYRRTWYANSVLMRTAAHASATLGAHGIDALLVGRAALLATHPDELGTRPAHAADLLVRPADLRRAAAALRGAAPGARLRLHAPGLLRRRHPERRAWRAAARVELHGTGVLVPSPADLLVLIRGGGIGWGHAPLRRYVDALLVARRAAP